MELVSLVWFKNETYDDVEEALVDITTDHVILNGDYYHNKISDRIEGFIEGLKYVGVDVDVQIREINPNHSWFQMLDFYDGSGD